MLMTLDERASNLLAAAPVSVELPAGTGKTHLLAAAVKEAARQGRRSLILTHTNAGVDAIRKRLARFQVSTKLYTVETITSWAFRLARSYQVIAKLTIPEAPDWKDSDAYLQGAIDVANSSAIRNVVRLSYDYLLVDEYQDCTGLQHKFIMTLRDSIPTAIVFGDPLQSIFRFGKNRVVDWDEDVVSAFPPHSVELVPHRWERSNPSLGRFTLGIRQKLQPGNWVDLGNSSASGVVYIPGDPTRTLAQACYSLVNTNESVAVLTKWPLDEDRIARILSGRFSVVEPINGRRMANSLKELPKEGDPLLAKWFAVTAKKFHVGLSGIDARLISKLGEGKSVASTKRKGIQEFVNALAKLQQHPHYRTLLDLQSVPGALDGVRCSYSEAWRDIFRTIQYAVEEESPDMVANLAVIRSRYRNIERRIPRLIVSRTLIVKGLEFDHVVIGDLQQFSDPCDLYVALSRAKKSVTVLGRASSVLLQGARHGPID